MIGPSRRLGSPDAVLLRIAYDGGPFSGFAYQTNARTVAGELLTAARAVDPTILEMRGASRTDAGVHARDQYVAFDPTRDLPPPAWQHELNRRLPRSIAVRTVSPIARGFSPRRHALHKTYRYLVLVDSLRDPLHEGRAWRIDALDFGKIELVRDEARAITGTHDFAAFRSAHDMREQTERTLHSVTVDLDDDDDRLVRVEVTGSGFMHNMVRIIVGTLVDVGRSRCQPGACLRALASKNRRDLGMTAPSDGLYLWNVELDPSPTGSDPGDSTV